jgi:hypothetical protein
MRADPAPHDVHLARPHLRAELEGRPAVRRPGQLPDVFMALHLLDAEAFAEARAGHEVRDEDCDGSAE